jgi:predicted RNA binding protein YcfA (HicA-like mRNA interferase family)
VPRIPGVNHQDAVRALQKAGFRVVRQGKHIVMTDNVRIITIPRHNPVNAFTMGGIVRDAGLTDRGVPRAAVERVGRLGRVAG